MLENATNLCILNKDLFKKQLFSPRINGPILSYSKVLMFPFISLRWFCHGLFCSEKEFYFRNTFQVHRLIFVRLVTNHIARTSVFSFATPKGAKLKFLELKLMVAFK